MSERKSTVTIILIVVILLVVVALVYRSSSQKRKAVEEQEPMAEKPSVEQPVKPPAVVPEVPAPAPAQPPEEVPAAAPPAPVEQPVVEPVPPPVTLAECVVDSPATIKKRKAGAPEGMVYVPAGAFTMGSREGVGAADEEPSHSVCLNGFYIDTHEVTNAQFKKFVEATDYVTEAERNASPGNDRTWRHPYGPDSDVETMSNYPVVCVSWSDAVAYAKWAGKRLPTEAEWEKAARGTDGRTYPWGNGSLSAQSANVADKQASLKWSDMEFDDSHATAAPVGSFPQGNSVYGVEDMAGNVWEWCLDWWRPDYYRDSPALNPTGPEEGDFKVMRGGSWFYSTDGARAAQRMYFRPNGSSAAIGFRCVKDII